ncbi:MAG: protein translocase subunit SecA 2 [Myxococcales bacterium]
MTPSIGRARDAPGPFGRLLDRVRARPLTFDPTPYLGRLAAARALETQLLGAPDAALRAHAERLRAHAERLRAHAERLRAASPPQILALAAEVARRTLGMRPFDVQLVGAMVLIEGRVLEMETGEGKTLVAALAAVHAALSGRRTHVLTFNDYLARRDAVWMGPLYDFLGVDVAAVHAGLSPHERRAAYGADVTYVTAKEAGFDHLRDGLCATSTDRVHRGFDVAIVDEADSLLIDEARIPLVIAGDREERAHSATRVAALVRSLDPALDYVADPAGLNVSLTEAGMARVEAALGCGSLEEPDNLRWLTEVNLALHAENLLRRDVDYIVRDGAIVQVDEFTGRVVEDRRWPDGLQTALEAKEGLRFRREGRVLGQITIQHFVASYAHLSGMTATARPAEDELMELYGLDVVVLPPNRPCIREDLPDLVYTHREARDLAVVAEIRAARGRPVLVGTASVRDSESLAQRLTAGGIPCAVLNAKTDSLEARIVAEAGAIGAVTISTNMAGRGTDIRLGGADERERARVAALGGLYVIGTSRHESRRIDRQLRGRAGRQGDPGTSRFFISLEDDLIVRYSVDELLPRRARRHQLAPVGDPLVRRRIDQAQRVIEGQGFDMRHTLWRYSSIVEAQRRVVRERRDAALDATPPQPHVAACLDRLWADHLAAVDELREGIYLVRFAGRDPLDSFMRAVAEAFDVLMGDLETAVAQTADPTAVPAGPSSTWTYLVDDDPFREALGLHVATSLGLSLGAVLHAPLYLAVVVWRRFFKR